MYVLVRAKSLQSCPTLCDPVDCSLPGCSIHGILHARILEWVVVPSSNRCLLVCVCVCVFIYMCHSSTLAWKIPWVEEPGRQQSMGSRRVGYDWVTSLSHFTFHALEKEMATHSSVLAWRIPGTGEPGGLPSVGSHRVGHDWSDLAVAAAANSRAIDSLSSQTCFIKWPS